MADRPTCKTCVHWDAGREDRGTCHRFPVQWIGYHGSGDCRFPNALEHESCGEHDQSPWYLKALRSAQTPDHSPPSGVRSDFREVRRIGTQRGRRMAVCVMVCPPWRA
jgi:hypothetical protein